MIAIVNCYLYITWKSFNLIGINRRTCEKHEFLIWTTGA